jgi:hypothetical protein
MPSLAVVESRSKQNAGFDFCWWQGRSTKLDAVSGDAFMGQGNQRNIFMKPLTGRKVGRPTIGDCAMTSGERSKKQRALTKGKVHSRSIELTTTAKQELQRAADQAGLSVNGALLVAIYLLTKETPVEIADLAKLVARRFGTRVEFTNEDGTKTRIGLGRYGNHQ